MGPRLSSTVVFGVVLLISCAHGVASNAAGERAFWGLEYEATDAGVVVHKVLPGGPAQDAGVAVGDLIKGIRVQPGEFQQVEKLTLKEVAPRSKVELLLSDGRVLVGTPIESSEELRNKLCVYSRGNEAEVTVVDLKTGADETLTLAPELAMVKTVRERFGYRGAVNVVSGRECGSRASPVIIEAAPDSTVLPWGTAVILNPDTPVKAYTTPDGRLIPVDAGS